LESPGSDPVIVRQRAGIRAEASAVGIVFRRRRRVHETGIRGIIAASVASSVLCAQTARWPRFFHRRNEQRAQEAGEKK